MESLCERPDRKIKWRYQRSCDFTSLQDHSRSVAVERWRHGRLPKRAKPHKASNHSVCEERMQKSNMGAFQGLWCLQTSRHQGWRIFGKIGLSYRREAVAKDQRELGTRRKGHTSENRSASLRMCRYLHKLYTNQQRTTRKMTHKRFDKSLYLISSLAFHTFIKASYR